MWTPKHIHFKNLLSHVDSEFDFSNGRCTVVTGINNCDRGLENNGSGKSVLFDAISLALTNKIQREDSDKEKFINDEAESCEVEFSLENAAIKSTLTIIRKFSRGNKAVKVQLIENGEVNKQITSAAQADKRILELVGIGREDLLRYYIIAQDNNYTFFKAADTEKKEVMNRITSADMINPILEKLSTDKKELTDKLAVQDGDLNNAEYKVQLLQEQIAETKKRIVQDSAIQDVEDDIKQLKQTNKELNNRLAERSETVKNKQAKLDKIPESDVKGLKKTLADKEKEYDEKYDAWRDSQGVVTALQGEVSKVTKCPHCGKTFIRDSELGVTPQQAKQLLKEAKQEETKLNKEIISLKDVISQTNADIKIARRNNEDRQDLQDVIGRLERKNDDDLESINHNLRKIKLYQEKIEQLKQRQKDDTGLKKLENDLTQTSKEHTELKKQRKVTADKLDMVSFWNYNMGKMGFSTFLANKSIDIIAGITNTYLSKFDTDIKVSINGFKVLKSGEVRDKIEVFVSNDGITLQPFTMKSGGERSRVTIAGILGIQHLINMSVSPLGLDLLVLDETLGATDRLGTMNIIETLNKVGTTILFVTQNIEDTKIYPNHLIVEKGSDGVSKIIR